MWESHCHNFTLAFKFKHENNDNLGVEMGDEIDQIDFL